jgi:protein-disulfide isomerase
MPSGKRSRRRRQQARTPPPVRSRAGRGRASPKVLIGAAVALAVVGGVVGAVVALTGGSSSKPAPTRLPDAATVQKLFAGIPQSGNALGSPSAPATVVEYVDLQCPFCQEFETQALPTVLSRYVRPGKATIQARPIAFIGPDWSEASSLRSRLPNRTGCST